ncbi:MAG TPA: L-seryl-tRNA(Sec) selenium transferase [Thermoleophilaceae bacterium]
MERAAGSRELGPEARDALRALPSVEELAARVEGVPHALAVRAARAVLAERRTAILGERRLGEEAAGIEVGSLRVGMRPKESPPRGNDALVAAVRSRAAALQGGSLRSVLNATGDIVHTNLGRAPLAEAAAGALAEAAHGYVNLELDLGAGARGSRQSHAEAILRELTGAEAAIVVNNCAAAVLLAAAALASGRELVVSRGQLVEIGGSFRVPDVVAQSGARLVEVGTTNRTRLADYERALGPDTGAIMRAHQSNFRTVGFVEEVEIEELCALGVPVIDDLGSGALAEGVPELAGEPGVRRSVEAGAAVVCFSGDKLLGGPQAGVMVGRADAIERCRTHPLARALRIDKLSLAALTATLRLYLDPASAAAEVPVLRMLAAPESELRARAEAMRDTLTAAGVEARVIRAAAKVGGGALPLLELDGPVCAVDPAPLSLDELAALLRRADPPVVARAREGWLLLDPRTLDDAGAGMAAAALISVVR